MGPVSVFTAAGRPCDRLGTLGRARWEDAARGARGPDWREIAGTLGWADGGSVADGRRQAGSGIARSRARARLNWVSQGQRCGRCRVRRRAERVEPSGQGEEPSPKGLQVASSPDRSARPAPGCGPHLYRQPSAVGCGSDRRRRARSRMAFSISACGGGRPPVPGSGSVPVGDEAVISVRWRRGPVGNRVGFTRRTMSRTGAAPGSVRKGV